MNLAELKKNSWIYSSKASLVGIAVVYILSLALASAFSDGGGFGRSIFSISLAFFGIFTTFWGMFAVSGAIISELRNRTWVYQKMSAIRAFDMCVGKLFGPTLYQWLLGMIFLAIAFFVMLGFGDDKGEALVSIINLVLATLLLHASALVLSLLAIRRKEYSSDIGNIRSAPMIMIMAIVLISAMRFLAIDNQESTSWYGLDIDPMVFNLVSLAAFMLWSLLAFYRNMREELLYQNRPFYWVAFNIFLLVFYGGLVLNGDLDDGMEVFKSYFAVSFTVLLVATLMALFLEPINVISYSSLVEKIRDKKWRQVFDGAPLWGISAAFSLFVCLLLCVSLFKRYGFGAADDYEYFFLMPLVAFLFLIKSLMVNLYLHLAQVSRANFIWFLYMVVWYGLLPALLGFGVNTVLFYPIDVIISGLAVLFYLAVLTWLVRRVLAKAKSNEAN